MSTRTFPTKTVVSIITGRHYCDDFGDIYDILGHLTGCSLMTHELPAAGRAAEPILRDRYPELAAIEPIDTTDTDELRAWIERLAQDHGATRDVEPLPAGTFHRGDPFLNLLRMMGEGVQG